MCNAVNELFADQIKEKDVIIAGMETQLATMGSQLADKDSQIADMDSQIADKDSQIAELQAKLDKYAQMYPNALK